MTDNKEISLAIEPEEPEEFGLSGFEKKYKAQMRQIVTQKLDLPISTLPSMLENQITINPEFQRRDRWDESRQSRLIESLLMNVPIPPIFLGEDDYGQYVVLDGRQRLTAIQNFLNNTLVLKDLDVWDDLNGHRFVDLVNRGLDKHLTRRFLSAITLLKESSAIIKYDVFDRLNTGGVKANEMEVRNAVFRGPFTDALHKFTRTYEFCKAWEIPFDRFEAQSNALYQTMTDLTIALRFFALQDTSSIDLPFKDHLSAFMESRNKEYAADSSLFKSDEQKISRALKNSIIVFGDNTFRNTTKKTSGPRSLPVADAVTIGLSDISTDDITPEVAEKLRLAFAELCNDHDFSRAISSGTNGKGAIRTRVNMARDRFKAVIKK